ncbi:hypothetical protein NKJ48_31115 [Mesorhizobium sp. M0114]|uniref:hypothetical protein n=1 Tax=unclassified Mesorhizobium TaxID=325217 RepID=UPI00333A276E
MLKPTPLRSFAVLAFVGALLLLAAWQSGLTGEICEKANQENETCAPYNLAFFIIIKLREFVDNNEGLITALATIVIAAFTGTLWKSTHDLGVAGERQMTLIETNAAQQSIDMQASTKAAQDAVRVMQKSAEQQLRAYVLAAESGIEFPFDNDPVAHVVIKNFGQTPAYDVRSWIHIWVEEFPLPAALPGPPPDDFPMSQTVCGPGFHTEFVHKRENPLNPISIKMINDETAAIYVYGAIKYRDCFGVERGTSYLRFFRGKFVAGDTKQMSSYPDGNEAT